jgi:23S rRNA pseudouridine2457 synthase
VNNGPKKGKKRLLGELHKFGENTMAIGRLDEKSEGLLLLTTDGKLSNYINSGNIEKEYYAQVDGLVSQEALKRLQTGVEIGIKGNKYMTKPCRVTLIDIPNFPSRTQKIRDDRHGPTSWISVTLTEGKFRQVRKMTAAVGLPTLRLVRVRIGTITLENLTVGEVIKVNELAV